MDIKNTNKLTDRHKTELCLFIQRSCFNSSISFMENDMNYYEDFPCFFIASKNDKICAFMSIFNPDDSNFEVYLHIDKSSFSKDDFNTLYLSLKSYITKYDIPDTFFVFDNKTDIPSYINEHITFSHSECLMQYDMSYDFNMAPTIEYQKEINENNILLKTYCQNQHIGICEIEFSDNYALIHDVEVFDAFKGLGYGTKTLRIAIDILKDMRIENILLHVNSANTVAYTMYSHHGFKIKEQIDYYYLN